MRLGGRVSAEVRARARDSWRDGTNSQTRRPHHDHNVSPPRILHLRDSPSGSSQAGGPSSRPNGSLGRVEDFSGPLLVRRDVAFVELDRHDAQNACPVQLAVLRRS